MDERLSWVVLFAIPDGDDPDWATWYAAWLVNLSRVGDLVGPKPVRSELTCLFVGLDKEYVQIKPSESREEFYAAQLVRHFANR
jgi:hypothetical protein